MKELDKLKYEIYKKSKKQDYLTFKQFIENQNVAYTFWELEIKKSKKDLKKQTKWLYISSYENSKN